MFPLNSTHFNPYYYLFRPLTRPTNLATSRLMHLFLGLVIKNLCSMYQDFSYRRGDWLVFGSETTGLPPEALDDCKNEPHGGGTLKIPMVETYVRCLNLSVSVGIGLYEASRQLNYEQLQSHTEPCNDTQQLSFVEDAFA